MYEADVAFEVEVREGFFKDQVGKDINMVPAEGHYYIVRIDTNTVLGTCKERFKPLQNHEVAEFIQPFISDGTCIVDTIGNFNKGEKVWFLLELTNHGYSVAEDDEIVLYMLVINGHDGSTSVRIGIVPVRVWCANMFSMLARSDFKLFKFKHTGNPAEHLQELRASIDEQLVEVDSLIAVLKVLATREVYPTDPNLDKYFRKVFKVKEDASTKNENKIFRLKELFTHGQGNHLPSVRNTWYAAYNAVTEYLSYEAGRKDETRLSSLWLGANAKVNKEALMLAKEYGNV
jgi:phage/plasmid-like protein (TIGR03299 family)